MSRGHLDIVPIWSWVAPCLAAILVALALAAIVPKGASPVLLAAAVGLGASVFASVHHAEILALRVGEPLGSVLLAGAVTIIEVALIVSIMLSGAEGSDAVARDTVYSALMIVLNGVIGLCLLLGGGRHHEQTFRLDAASTSLAVLGTLAVLVLVLPNFAVHGGPQQFAPIQLVVVGLVSLTLYATFVFVQTISHRDYFMDEEATQAALEPQISVPGPKVTLVSAILLPVSLTIVVLLAKILSQPLSATVQAAGLPNAVVGVVIAAVVLLPEGIASVRAALSNRLQNSVNLVLGSALASIGMTIPVVAAVSVATGSNLILGLEPSHIALLLLTLFVGTITLGTGRTTLLQGVVHLGIFAVFLLLSAVP